MVSKQTITVKEQTRADSGAYIVPATLVLTCVFSSSSSLANPKSDIFGVRSLSSKILVALMSLCTNFNGDSSWRNARPFAIPQQILNLVGQSSGICLCFGPKTLQTQTPFSLKHQKSFWKPKKQKKNNSLNNA